MCSWSKNSMDLSTDGMLSTEVRFERWSRGLARWHCCAHAHQAAASIMHTIIMPVRALDR